MLYNERWQKEACVRSLALSLAVQPLSKVEYSTSRCSITGWDYEIRQGWQIDTYI